MGILISFLCSLWCCVSLRVTENEVNVGPLFRELKKAQPGELCNIMQSKGPYNSDDIFDLAKLVFNNKDHNIHSLEVLRCFVETMKLRLDAEGYSRETLLFPAVQNKRVKSIKYLLAHGVPEGKPDSSGWSPAMKAIGWCTECLDEFLKTDSTASKQRCASDCIGGLRDSERCRTGFTLAHFAAEENDTKSMQILKHHDVDFNATDGLGWSPVHVAVRYNHLEALQELGTLHASFNIADKKNRTPAYLACEYVADSAHLKQYLDIILRFGGRASLSARDHHNRTPAHICASAKNERERANPEGLQFLYDNANESFDQRDYKNRTPEEVAHAERNSAELWFANLKARKNEAKARDFATKASEAYLKARENEEKATESARKAHESEEQAEKNEQRAERSAREQQKLAWAVKNATEQCQALSKQVDALFDCEGELNNVTNESKVNITVPSGIMIANGNLCPGKNASKYAICAMRCPNPLACAKRRWFPFGEPQCGAGYNNTSAGCSRCREGYGRHRQDPFQCKMCASSNLRWLSWIAYAIKPLGIYSVTLWTAQKVEKNQLGSLLKIWMSFGVVVACISPSIKTSQSVTAVCGGLEKGVASGEDLVSITTQLSGPSFDCLLGTTNASMTAWLLLSCAPALALWVLSIIYAAGRRLWMQEEIDLLTRDALKVNIAITNCFLPDMVAALARYFSCIHFQNNDNYKQFLQYSVETLCSDVTGMRIVALFAACLVGAVGPLFWVAVIKKSEAWTEKYRKATLGFLVSGYRPEVCWWEATVLIRKCVVALAAALFSVSYAPMLYLSSLLLIVGLSLAGHAYIQPYEDKFLNRLEFGTLVASFVAVFCTFILKLEALDWATDRTVTIFAFVLLFVVVTIPGVSLIGLYFKEVLKRDLRLDILGTSTEEVDLPPSSDAKT